MLIAVWYLGLTAVSLAFAYRDGGVRRATGVLIIGSYLVFLGSLLATAHAALTGGGGRWRSAAGDRGGLDGRPGPPALAGILARARLAS